MVIAVPRRQYAPAKVNDAGAKARAAAPDRKIEAIHGRG